MSDLGYLLLETGLISEAQLNAARKRQRVNKIPLDVALLEAGAVFAEDLLDFFQHKMKIPIRNPLENEIPKELISLISKEIAQRFRVIPVAVRQQNGKRTVELAMADPTDETVAQKIREVLGDRFSPCAASSAQIEKAIGHYYNVSAVAVLRPAESANIIEEVKALTRMVVALRDLLLENGVIDSSELEKKLSRRK